MAKCGDTKVAVMAHKRQHSLPIKAVISKVGYPCGYVCTGWTTTFRMSHDAKVLVSCVNALACMTPQSLAEKVDALRMKKVAPVREAC